MPQLFQTVTDFEADQEILRGRHYGVVETTAGRLSAIHLKPWPTLVTWPEFWPVGSRYHAQGSGDLCRLYYNQPRNMPNFLALKFVVSTADTSYATVRAALTVLDAIARLKQTDAIVCDAANLRISDRLLARFGWEPHKPQRWHRNFIRRFYDAYPEDACPEAVSF